MSENWDTFGLSVLLQGIQSGTNGRRAAVQIGGVLRRFKFSILELIAQKPARYSVTNGGGTAVQIGGVQHYFLDKLYGLGVPKQ